MTQHAEPANNLTTKTIRGRAVPTLGIGTWQLTGSDAIEAVAHGLVLGYRHIDTASIYGNERDVGEGIRQSGARRSDFWLTTKVWINDITPARVRASAERSLENLGVDHLDLLLLHWPPSDNALIAPALEALQSLRADGVIDEFGVGNFTPRQFERALAIAPETFANQVEFHPHLHQRRLLEIAEQHDVLIQAHAPLGAGKQVLDSRVLGEVASEVGANRAQVALAWLLAQTHVCALPRSIHASRRMQYLKAQHIVLSADQIARIDELADSTHARHFNPSFGPTWRD